MKRPLLVPPPACWQTAFPFTAFQWAAYEAWPLAALRPPVLVTVGRRAFLSFERSQRI